MILGTVELGMDYGINNTSGKPSFDQAMGVLDAAKDHGITELDTAAAYGDSETIIGHYHKVGGHVFEIDTKLPTSLSHRDLQNSLSDSLRKLSVGSINVLYLHSFEQCKDETIVSFLKAQQEAGTIRHIGISIYEPEELRYILERLPGVDTVQIPFNILDNDRWRQNGLLNTARDKKVRLYARSVFLQGLFFKSGSDAFVQKIGAEKYINALHALADQTGCSMAELAYLYVAGSPEINEVIIGCQSVNDVKENSRLCHMDRRLSTEERKEIEAISAEIPRCIIDPRTWNRI